MPHEIPDQTIDLTDQVCPMTFVRARLALDALEAGQILAILLCGAEPTERVPHTVRQLGHEVLDETAGPDGVVRLLVRRV